MVDSINTVTFEYRYDILKVQKESRLFINLTLKALNVNNINTTEEMPFDISYIKKDYELFIKELSILIEQFEKTLKKISNISSAHIELIYSQLVSETNQFNNLQKHLTLYVVKDKNLNKFYYDFYDIDYFDNFLVKLNEFLVELCIPLSNNFIIPSNYPVLLQPQVSTIFFHETIGHLLEADNYINSQKFLNQLLSYKFSDELNIVDDPTTDISLSSYCFDSFGIQSSPLKLVENGKIINFMCDNLTSTKLNIPATSHGRKGNPRKMPQTRHSNLIVSSGKGHMTEKIESMEYGFYIKSVIGGINNIRKFVIETANGYIIKNGEICEKVRNVLIFGNTIDTLIKVKVLDDYTERFASECTKRDDSVWVSIESPPVFLESVGVKQTKVK